MVRNVDVDGNPVNASVTSSVVIVNAGDDVPTRFQFDVANSTSEDFENSSIAIYVNGSRLKGDQRANLDSSSECFHLLRHLLSRIALCNDR